MRLLGRRCLWDDFVVAKARESLPDLPLFLAKLEIHPRRCPLPPGGDSLVSAIAPDLTDRARISLMEHGRFQKESVTPSP